jgi:hypothetical protein
MTRITVLELESDFELFVDRAATGETFVFEYGGKDFVLTGMNQPVLPNRLIKPD